MSQIRFRFQDFAADAANQTASVQTALELAVGTPEVGVDVSITLATVFPAGVPASLTPSIGSIASGTWTLPITSFVGSATLRASSAGVTLAWLVTWEAASVLSVTAQGLPAVGTQIAEGDTLTFQSITGPAVYTVAPGGYGAIRAGNGAERVLDMPSADGEALRGDGASGGAMIVSRPTSQYRATLAGDGFSLELLADGDASASHRVIAAVHEASSTALLRVYGASGLCGSASGSLTGWTPEAVHALAMCRDIRRTLTDGDLPAPYAFAATVEAEPGGAVRLIVSDTEPVAILSQANLGDTAALDAIAAALPPALATRRLAVVESAATPVAAVLPGTMTVGAELSPGTPSQDGPNLATLANAGTAPPEVTNKSYEATYVEFDVTAQCFNHILVQQSVAALPLGAVVVIENLAASPAPVRAQHRTNGANVTLADIAPGQAVTHTVAAGFENIRLSHFNAGVNFRVRVWQQAAVPAQSGPALDLNACFTGGVEPRAVSVAGLPPGVVATGGVIPGSASPAAGAGGEHRAIVTATDAAGASVAVERLVTVNEAFSIQSAAIVDLQTGLAALAVGATAGLEVAWRGFPGPYAPGSGLWPQWRYEWRDQTGAAIGSDPTLVVPPGVTSLTAVVWFALSDTTATPTVTTAAVAVTGSASEAPTVPTVSAAASASRDGRTVTINAGSAQGNPAPNPSLHALTEDGADVLASATGTGPWSYTAAGTDEDEVGFVVRWTNDAGTADSSGSVTVPATAATTPAAIASTDWRVVSAVTDGTEVFLAIDRIPSDATRLDVEIAGVVQALDKVSPGVFRIGSRPAGTAQNYRVRAANASGDGAWSDQKSATATAASNTRLACWADGEKAHALTAAPTGLLPFDVTGGGEAEVIRASTSAFKTKHISTGDKALGPIADTDIGDWIFFDPKGSGAALKPCETSTRSITTSLGATTIVVHGAAGMVTRRAPSVLGYDGDRDPVAFRFDRPMDVGRLPDGRPFVVGTAARPARIVHNGGDPIAITPDATKGYALVSLDGAVLAVVARAGIIPPLAASAADLKVVHGYAPAYTRRAGVYDFGADGWNDVTAAAAPSTGLTLRPTYEHVAIHYAGSGTATCKVRFRKVGDANFHPALDLWYDDRDLTGYPEAFMHGKHRGLIVYLEPGAQYEVQIKDGSTYRKATVATWSRKPTKASEILGTVTGDVVISRSGDTVTVTRGTLAPLSIPCAPGGYAELHSGLVRDGMIRFADNAARVILTGIDAHGALTSPNTILIGKGCSDLRIVGGRSSAWGTRHANGFANKHVDCIRLPDSDGAWHSISVLGRWAGSPRFPANTWQETGVDGSTTWSHPDGAFFLGAQNTSNSRLGRTVMSDCAWTPWTLRNGCDGFSAGLNKADLDDPAGFGPGSFFAWNAIENFSDDGCEMDTDGAGVACLHNVFTARHLRKNTYLGNLMSLSWLVRGPILLARNLYLFEAANGITQAQINTVVYKVQPGRLATDPAWSKIKMGRKWVYHETCETLTAGRYPTRSASRVNSAGFPVLGFHAANCLMRVNGAAHDTSHGTNSFASTWLDDTPAPDANKSLDADFLATGSALVGDAGLVPNINDGGPFYQSAAQRAIGWGRAA